MAPKGDSRVPRRVARGPRVHTPGGSPLRPRETRPPPRAPTRSPGAVTFQRLTQAARGGEPGGGAGARLGPGGGTRKLPPRPEPPCNRRRPPRSRAARAPATRRPWGTRTRTRAVPWSCRSPKVGQGVARGAGRVMAGPAGRGRFMHRLGSFAPCAHSQPDGARGEGRRGELPAAQGAGHGR